MIVGGALVAAGAFWFLVIRAQNKSLEQYALNYTDLDDKSTRSQRMIKRKAAIQSELAEQRQKLAEAEAQMIPFEQVRVNKWISDKLKDFIQHRYEITLLRLTNPTKGNQFLLLPKFDYSAVAYDVELQAHYHEFSRFLADFEATFPYFSIQKLQMWPLATSSAAAAGTAGEISEEGPGPAEREQLKIIIRVVLLFKPVGAT